MKRTLTLALFCCLPIACGGNSIPERQEAKTTEKKPESVAPIVAPKFGEVIAVEGIFVEKTNTYYDQNIDKNPFSLKVVAVEGNPVKNPVVIEYEYLGKEKLVAGVTYKMRAYEDFYSVGPPHGWTGQLEQINYMIKHHLYIKDLVIVQAK